MEEERNAVSEAEDVDIQMRLCCSSEGLSDDKACMWLCSGSTSTSFLSSDDLQSLEILDIDFCDTLLSRQSVMLPVLDVGNRSTIFNDSAMGPGEASPALTRRQDSAGANLISGDGNKAILDTSKGSSECVESVHGRSCSEDSPSNFNGSSPSPGVHVEPNSPSGCNDLDRIDIWVPSIELDKEESEWDRSDGYDGLGPDFPSPSYRILRNLRVRTNSKLSFCPSFKRLLDIQPSLGSPSTSIFDLSLKHALGVSSPRSCLRADEPLFWPFDSKSYWRPEFEGNYLGISPRAGIFRIKRPRGRHAPKSAGAGLQHNMNNRINGPSLHKESIRQRYGRRILVSSRSAQPALATQKARGLNNQVPHASKVPSRLSRSTAFSSEKSARNAPKRKGKDRRQSGSGRKKRGRDQKSTMVEYLLEFEAGDFQVYLGGEIPIEALVGLDEFDGHEGVGKMMRAS